MEKKLLVCGTYVVYLKNRIASRNLFNIGSILLQCVDRRMTANNFKYKNYVTQTLMKPDAK